MGAVSGSLARKTVAETLAEGNTDAQITRGLLAIFCSDEDREETVEEWASAQGFALDARRVA